MKFSLRNLSMTQKVLVSLVIGGAFLAVVLWGIEWHELGEALVSVRWALLVPVVIIMLFTHLWRTHRWWVLVNAAHRVSFRSTVAHCLVGFLAINAIPFRGGEFVRPFLLKTEEGVPFSLGLATCIVERLLDILALAVMLAIVLWAGMPTDALQMGDTEVSLVLLSRIAFGVVLVGIGGLVALIALRGLVLRVVETMVGWISKDLAARVVKILGSFVDGLKFLKGVGTTTYVTVSSILIWMTQATAFWLVTKALRLDQVDLAASQGVMAVTMVGVSIPAGPAFVGTWELFCTAALGVYGVPKEDGLAVSVITHIVGLTITVVLGLIALGGVTGLVKLAKAAQSEGATQKTVGSDS